MEAESKKAADLENKKAADLENKKAADLADEQAAAAEKAKLEAMSAEEAEQLKIKKEKEEAVLAEAKAKKDKIAADKAEFLRQQQEKKLEALESGLKTAMADVQNPNQFDRVKKQLGLLLNSPVCEPDGRDKAIITEAEILIKKLEHMYLLSQAIANLNQKTIAEIRSFDNPKEEIVETMRCTFLLLGEDPKDLKEWNDIRALIGKMGKASLKRKIGQFTIAKAQVLSKRVIKKANEINDKVDVGKVKQVSSGAATFYAWCKGVLGELNAE